MNRFLVLALGALFSAAILTSCADDRASKNISITNTNRSTGNDGLMNGANAANSLPMNATTPINSNSVMNANSSNMSNAGASVGGAADFMTKAAQGGIAEVELGRMAMDKAQNAEVKRYAQTMVQDHTAANNELKAIATKKNMTPPAETDAEHKAVMTRLQGLSGAEFDRAYMEAMVADHEKTVALFETGANTGTDADVKQFAAKTLPKLRMHLDMAKEIHGKLK
jgi:putative membrane protein